jgi:ASC-1-like (ASCH) protein
MKRYRLIIREEDRNLFNQLVSGSKTIDTRAATSKYKNVQVGDILKFVCGQDELSKIVVGAVHYSSLDNMYGNLPMESILPSAHDISDAKRIHYSFPGYKEKLETYGVMAFKLGT